MEFELLEKTEIWIKPIRTRDVNLTTIAEEVARVLNLEKSEVFVIDVRDEVIALDILKKTVKAEDILGKREAILSALSGIPGVSLTPHTAIHSEGILGLIDIGDKRAAKNILKKMERMEEEISKHVHRRVIVFPSGFEIEKGLIRDTNTPYIVQTLNKEGYSTTVGQVLEDSLHAIVAAIMRAVNDGFGLIITTGGVGAEDKDRMIEALLELDPTASTPYIIHYEQGKGRHEKDGVKVGVAYINPSLIVALPGPHPEVRAGMQVIIDGLKRGLSKEDLATGLKEKYIEVLKKAHQKP